VPRPPHDVNRENPALMARKEVINEIPDDRVRLVAELRHDTAD